jgi:hypothetical protein
MGTETALSYYKRYRYYSKYVGTNTSVGLWGMFGLSNKAHPFFSHCHNAGSTHLKVMSNDFAKDQEFWDELTAPVDSYSTWSFSSNMFYIGSSGFALSDDDNYRASFELGLFDVHYTYWRSRAQNTHSYFYHTRLRSAVEAYFNNQTGRSFICPPILQPWLWRTFCLCPQTLAGRAAAAKLMSKYEIVFDGSQRPIGHSRKTFFYILLLGIYGF